MTTCAEGRASLGAFFLISKPEAPTFHGAP